MPSTEEKLSPLQPQGGVLGIGWVVVPVRGDPERWGHAPQGTNIYLHSLEQADVSAAAPTSNDVKPPAFPIYAV